LTGPLTLRYAALSDLGRYRKDNQDSGFASEHLLVIADGVGGAAYGDVASHTAVQIMRRLDAPAPEDVLEALAGTIHRIHDRLAELVEHDPELDGTSTTVTAGLFDGTSIGIAHLGDSRAYLLRGGQLRRLTKDHTFVQTLVDEGRISEEESRTHPHRNLILRAVDGVHDTEPDLFLVELEPGDRLLFCSDGCSGVLDDAGLAELLGSGSVDYAAVELVRSSLDAGTTDNVTVVVAEVVAADAPPPDEDTSAATTTGPMLVGAAAGQPRKLSGGRDRHFFRRTGSEEHDADDSGVVSTLPPDVEEEPDPEELRYAPRAPRRLLWLRRLVVLVVLVALVAVGATLLYNWTQDQYYVSDDADQVAIFRGVDVDLPLVTMNRIEERTDLPLAALPTFDADQVRDGIRADDLADARRIVEENLFDVARPCPEPEPTPTPSPTERPRRQPTEGATRQPRPTRTPSPTPTPTPTPTLAPPDCIEVDATSAP
jgi:protein phosphatase